MGLNKVLKEERNEEMEILRELSLNLKEITDPYEEVSLHEFELYLLPFILKEIEYTDENTAIFNSNFLKLSKKYRVGLKVINNGKILYELPPLLGSLNIDDNKINFRKIVNTFNSTAESNPRIADKQLSKNLNIVEKTLKENNNEVNKYINTLSKIYKDYAHSVKNSKIVEKANNELEDDFLDY